MMISNLVNQPTGKTTGYRFEQYNDINDNALFYIYMADPSD